MIEKVEISASIVLYNQDLEELQKCIDCFINTSLNSKLYLVDNSPQETDDEKFSLPNIEYIYVGKNIGFGAGHNLIIDKIKNRSNYHLILNADVEFSPLVIPELIHEIGKHKDVMLIAPKVVFPNGKHQYSCRKYPTLYELFARRIGFPKSIVKKGEYQDKDLSKLFSPDFLHGCFQLFKTEEFVKLNGFDERYFMYMEDVDICRKIDNLGKGKLYYPNVQIIHRLNRESTQKIKLFFTHLSSVIKYFKKWGI